MVKQRDTFGNPLKEKLNDYRAHLLTLDEILEFIYSIDPKFEKKTLRLQNDRRKELESKKGRK